MENRKRLLQNWNSMEREMLELDSRAYWNLPAFLRDWKSLSPGEKSDAVALEQRYNVVKRSDAPKQWMLERLLDECWLLNKKNERLHHIIQSRCGFNGSVKSLESIGSVYRLSRERVRQLQVEALKNIRPGNIVSSLNQSLVWLIKDEGGAISTAQAGELFARYFCCGEVAPNAVFRLISLLYSDVKILTSKVLPLQQTLQYLPNEMIVLSHLSEDVELVLKTSRRLWTNHSGTLHSDRWVHEIADALKETTNPLSPIFIEACLRADGRFDPNRFDNIEVAFTVSQVMERALQKIGKPTHFQEIVKTANQMNLLRNKTTAHSAYNCLGRRQDIFVCVGKGTYGLASWGIAEQRVTRDNSVLLVDVIEQFLLARGKPTHFKEIIEEVQRKKRCKRSSIFTKLADKKYFRRTSKGVYDLTSSRKRALKRLREGKIQNENPKLA